MVGPIGWRSRRSRAAMLDPALHSEWAADALPPRCEAELAAVLPMGNATTLARSQLYGKFASGLGTQGLTVFKGGTMSQGMSLSKLFQFDQKSGRATAKLEPLEIPVRAVVLPLPAAAPAAARMHHTAKRVLDSEFPPTVGAPQLMLATSY